MPSLSAGLARRLLVASTTARSVSALVDTAAPTSNGSSGLSLTTTVRSPRNRRAFLSKIHSVRSPPVSFPRAITTPWRPTASTASATATTPGILAAAL